MREHKSITFLSENELRSVFGGNPVVFGFLAGYIVTEVINGIQQGISADCSEATCCNE